MTRPDQSPPVVWRLPPWQPALLFLVTAVLAALNIYSSPSPYVRAVTIVLAVAFLVAAVASARMYLVADDDGIGFRRFTGETSVAWGDIAAITVGKVRGGALTLQLERAEGRSVQVPPSLVLPTRPTSNSRTAALLRTKADQLRARRPLGQ